MKRHNEGESSPSRNVHDADRRDGVLENILHSIVRWLELALTGRSPH